MEREGERQRSNMKMLQTCKKTERESGSQRGKRAIFTVEIMR